MHRGRKVREDCRVFYRDLLLIVVAIRDPGPHLGTIERTCYEALMEGVLIVIARLADGMKPFDEVVRCRRDITKARVSACESVRSGTP
jgi:tRNA G18 (ribose-2'-O)-methylase SpoU